MKKRLLLPIFFSILFCGQVFAGGNIMGDQATWIYGATPAETTAQSRDDVWLSPSSVPYIRAASITTRTITDANVTLTSSDFGKTIRMNSASNYIAFLPSVGASDDGVRLRIVKTGVGKVTTDAADNDLINDSGAGDTIYNSTSEIYAFIDLEYVHAKVTWIVTGTGTWITTD